MKSAKWQDCISSKIKLGKRVRRGVTGTHFIDCIWVDFCVI